MTHQAQRVTAFFLLIILTGNFLLSVFWHDWRLAPPWHDHLILGPIHPGWEYHHGELTQLKRYPYTQGEPTRPLASEQVATSDIAAAVDNKVISLYRSPTGDSAILSIGVPFLWLVESPILPELSPLTWPLDLAALSLSSAFLPPPDEPPLYLSSDLH